MTMPEPDVYGRRHDQLDKWQSSGFVYMLVAYSRTGQTRRACQINVVQVVAPRPVDSWYLTSISTRLPLDLKNNKILSDCARTFTAQRSWDDTELQLER